MDIFLDILEGQTTFFVARQVVTQHRLWTLKRTFETTHPWINFEIDLTHLQPKAWMNLGEARSKCEHISGVPLRPTIAQELQQIYLVKGALATTAIEGNTLTEAEVKLHLRGKLKLPPSKEYLQQEIDNIVGACNR